MANIIIKDNGFKPSEQLLQVREDWEQLVESTFDNIKEIEYFYYGAELIMASVRLTDKSYGHFNITEKRVSFNGHTCTYTQYMGFSKCTWNDELYEGKLYK